MDPPTSSKLLQTPPCIPVAPPNYSKLLKAPPKIALNLFSPPKWKVVFWRRFRRRLWQTFVAHVRQTWSVWKTEATKKQAFERQIAKDAVVIVFLELFLGFSLAVRNIHYAHLCKISPMKAEDPKSLLAYHNHQRFWHANSWYLLRKCSCGSPKTVLLRPPPSSSNLLWSFLEEQWEQTHYWGCKQTTVSWGHLCMGAIWHQLLVQQCHF